MAPSTQGERNPGRDMDIHLSKSFPISDRVLEDVLSQYPFYEGKLDSLQPVARTCENVNAKFSIGDNAWVIKQHADPRMFQSLQLSQWYQAQLHEAGIRVAKLEPTNQGPTMVVHGDHMYSIQRWVSGGREGRTGGQKGEMSQARDR